MSVVIKGDAFLRPQGIEAFFRAETVICGFLFDELLRIFEINIAALTLNIWSVIASYPGTFVVCDSGLDVYKRQA